MKKTFTLLAISFFYFSGIAQNQLQIKGRVLDGESENPIEYASVSLLSKSDSSLIKGVVSDLEGKFTLEASPGGAAFIQVQFMGYDTYRSAVFQLSENLNIGNILLGVNPKILSEVEVTGREITALYKLDKQVFDAR